MAMIQCPECGTSISERAKRCPNCGFESNDATRPIAEQDKYVPVPVIHVEVSKRGGAGTQPLYIASDANRTLVECLKNLEWVNQMAPDLVTFVKEKCFQSGEVIYEAKFSDKMQQLLANGDVKLGVDRDNKILPQVVGEENKIRELARLDIRELSPDLTSVLQHMQTQAAIAQVLARIEDVQRTLDHMQIELQQDRLAKADAAQSLISQAYRVTDGRRRDELLNQVLQSAASAKSELIRNYETKRRFLDRESKPEKRSQYASDALESLVHITNAVHVQIEVYAIAGELAAQQYCMKEFKDFIIRNSIDCRDSLVQLNSAINRKYKQPQLVDQIFGIASQVVQLDLSEQIDSATDSKLIDANNANEEEITAEKRGGTAICLSQTLRWIRGTMQP